MQLLPLKSLVFVAHFLNAFWYRNKPFPKGSSQNEIVCPLLAVFHLPYSKYKGVKMFLLVSLSKSKFFTRVALVWFVQHSCRTYITLMFLVLHSCRIRVVRVWHSCCKLDQISDAFLNNSSTENSAGQESVFKNMSKNSNTRFFYKKMFYKKMSLKNPKTLRKCLENLQPQTPQMQFSETLIFPKTL